MTPRYTSLDVRQILAFEKGSTTAVPWQALSAICFGCFYVLSRYDV